MTPVDINGPIGIMHKQQFIGACELQQAVTLQACNSRLTTLFAFAGKTPALAVPQHQHFAGVLEI